MEQESFLGENTALVTRPRSGEGRTGQGRTGQETYSRRVFRSTGGSGTAPLSAAASPRGQCGSPMGQAAFNQFHLSSYFTAQMCPEKAFKQHLAHHLNDAAGNMQAKLGVNLGKLLSLG